MDMTTQIKNNLISRIKDSKDLNFLKAVQTIFDSSEQSLFQLTSEQEDSIEKGRDEIRNGESIENDVLIVKMKEWLTKK